MKRIVGSPCSAAELLLILVTLIAFCGLAAAKLRAGHQVGMTEDEVERDPGAIPYESVVRERAAGAWFA